MNQPKKPLQSLAEIEREVVAESREWRRRLAQRLQQNRAKFFPLAQAERRGVHCAASRV